MGKTLYPDVKIDPERQSRTLELQPTVPRGECRNLAPCSLSVSAIVNADEGHDSQYYGRRALTDPRLFEFLS